LPWVVPPYAANDLGIDARLIGVMLLANAATVVVAQVPAARLAEGRRRVTMIALAALVFSGACLVVLAADLHASAAYALLVVASIAIGIGEGLYSTALLPLVAELAPPGLRGRYMASIGLSWWIGLALGPTLGTQLLSVSPAAAFLTASAVAAGAAVSALALERRPAPAAPPAPPPLPASLGP